jgi:hypothetical protein
LGNRFLVFADDPAAQVKVCDEEWMYASICQFTNAPSHGTDTLSPDDVWFVACGHPKILAVNRAWQWRFDPAKYTVSASMW